MSFYVTSTNFHLVEKREGWSSHCPAMHGTTGLTIPIPGLQWWWYVLTSQIDHMSSVMVLLSLDILAQDPEYGSCG